MNRALSFNPDRMLEPGPPASLLFPTPKAWSAGLARLGDRRRPKNAEPDRWAQILADATKLATIWAEQAIEARWSIENLFGFDPEGGPDQGLVIGIRGARLCSIRPDYAAFYTQSGYRAHHPWMTSGCPLIWNFDESACL